MKVREELREPSNELRGFSELFPASMCVHILQFIMKKKKKKKKKTRLTLIGTEWVQAQTRYNDTP
jgi:hypothetical protein